ncbi:OmpA family protein [Geomonas nitrogeniifigens]|uniref:OmpA family protein n=1 Tax=Geomonas diazotrophica TaxID=2843197 RepID=A0ABX8JEW8_9BACT|nr:OmpA family protein [Geomonas nitrogeniifigens]QWV96934.1 OmpA family protein [Geomonas nitrogeniifigens]
MVKQSIALTFMILASMVGAETAARAESAPAATKAATATAAPKVREAAGCGETTEGHLPKDATYTPWLLDPSVFAQDQGDRTEKRQVAEKEVKTVKLADLVPPIRFRTGEAEITREYLELLRGVLEKMRGRANVRLHFVGHADTQRLSGALQAKFGDNTGLSRERAGTTAEYCQRALGLPPEAISYEGMGDAKPVASNATEEGRALNRRVEVEVWYDEIGEKMVEKEVVVPAQVNRVKVCRTETVCKMRYKEGLAHRVRVRNLVAPLQYDAALVTVPEEFRQQIRQALNNLTGKQNIAVKFIAYSDTTPLEARDERIYGDQLGLSKAVARRVALAVQDALKGAPVSFESEGKGATQPVASNDTPQGRARNRRVAVEFWHDDAMQELSDEPQLCPEDAGAETVTRVYDPPSGAVPPILFQDGNPVLPEGYTERLGRLMDEIKDRSNVRLRFTGYINNERLDRRTAAVYGDDIGWATARARRSMTAASEKMGLAVKQAEFEGRGYVQSADVVATGFTGTGESRVEVQVVYDEQVPINDYEGVDIVRMTREVNTADPLALNLLRISVDGKPVDDLNKSIPDLQRCTDVALERARIEFKYDDLRSEPRLNVTAWPRSIRYQDLPGTEFPENLVRFRLYANYHSFIKRAEVRIFEEARSVRDLPLAVVPMDGEGTAQWSANFDNPVTPARELKYLVRVYDTQGNYDETVPQPLWVVEQLEPGAAQSDPERELLAGYGGSRIAQRNIPVNGGTVQAYGSSIPPEHRVWLAGYPGPVDAKGRFIVEEILPKGMHTVEVAVLDKSGNGELFLRDLSMPKNNWFTVGIADLTLSADKTSGPAQLLAPDRPRYSHDFNAEGRLAFYTKGEFGDGWGLTASADTREGPLDEIFTNFLDKSPESLFRRIDQDYHLPTYGDDGTVLEDAPTSGKFYAKLKKDQNYGLWGNFRVGYLDNDLAHVDRGLYGANLHYQVPGVTSFGEKRFMVDGFAAEPGTVAGRDEFRGTGGSLYYLRRQDILQGSERVRIEIRDKDSGIVLSVKDLTPVQDYDVDYLQGRLVLTQPLESTAADNLLVHSDTIGGNPVFLVARYEYTPGVAELDTMTFGGRAHYWFGDHVKLGLTGTGGKEGDIDESLAGADLTLRQSAATWLKVETGRSKGAGLFTSTSLDGGFNYGTVQAPVDAATAANAYRVDASLGLQDFNKDWRGRFTLYSQLLEAGYSAPGQAAEKETTQIGGTAEVPVNERLKVNLKADRRSVDQGLETTAAEVNANYQVDEHWSAGVGARLDSRKDKSAVVPLTQETGDRTDLVGKVAYDTKARWSGYLFGQQSVLTTGNREDNGRGGVGGAYRVTDRFKVNGEVSGGSQGAAGRFGSEYLYSDRTTLYLNYALENERSDNGVQARKGSLTSGFRTRYSDSASVYGEERYSHGDVPSGLLHSYGVDLAPTDRLNFGVKGELGTLRDNLTGADLKRTALGVSAGYGFEKVKLSSAVEYRVDDAEQSDLSRVKRTTWLFKNNLKYQLTPDWRLIGKFNYSQSTSSQGDFYNGSYTEAVVGYAYRPVANDRLNALVKYTYFYNLPAAGQLNGTGTSAGVMQRSHIASIDATYDLTQRWSVGGKYAYRLGQVSMDRVNPEYFDSSAHLYVARVDWHFLHKWDALAEGRLLDLPDAQDRRRGVLLGLYRHLGNNFKVGAGYNFSDFSDDLTDMSYRHQGVFVNVVGMI